MTVYQVTYQSSGYEVPAYLAIPDGQGPFPAVLYAHGYGVGPKWFVPDAVALAREGYAGLLIQYPLSREPMVGFYSCDARSDIEGYVQYLVDLRRGLDLLETLPEIDDERIGVLGHSLGAEVVGILTGLEGRRVDAFVIMDGVGSLSEDTGNNECASLQDDELLRFREQIAVLNAVNYVGHDRGAALLFQVSSTMMEGTGYTALMHFEIAPEPKTLMEYPEYDHVFGCFDFTLCDPSLPPYVDHRAWLQENV